MSGHVTSGETTAFPSAERPVVQTARVEITESAASQVGGFSVRRITLDTRDPTRAVLVGGVPFDKSVLMWNYVARTRDEITTAHRDWTERAARFGHVDSRLPRYEIGPPPWRPQ